MQDFEITFIFDGKPKGLCPTYIEKLRASDYRTAIDHLRNRVEDFGGSVFGAFMHDDRGAVVYHMLQNVGELDT